MHGGEALDDGRADPGALEFAGVMQALEGDEDLRDMGRIEAGAIVANR